MTTLVSRDLIAAAAQIPIGASLPFWGGTTPPGWLLCNGQAVSRTTYALLFAAIGTAYGVGDGSTTFNLPDARGRALFGRDDMGGAASNRIQVATTLTTSLGSATATVGSAAGLAVGMTVVASTVPANVTITAISGTTLTLSTGVGVTAGAAVAGRFSLLGDAQVRGSSGGDDVHLLTVAQMPSHTHPLASVSNRNTAAGGSDTVAMNTSVAAYTTQSTGGDQPHPNLPPSILCDWMIYAGV